MKNKKKKNAFQKSKFGEISAVEILDSLYFAIGTIAPVVGVVFASGSVSKESLIVLGSTFLSTFLGGVFVKTSSNSKGKFLKKEDVL